MTTASFKARKSAGVFPFLAIFLVALALRLWFNFATTHINAAYAADAAEYLRDAQGFERVFSYGTGFWLTALQSLLAGNSTHLQEIQNAMSPLRELATGGPVLPFFIFASSRLSGAAPSFSAWQPPVSAYCLLTSLTCVLIGLIGRACWNRKTGILAGFMAAIYPGFIVNSGRLYSESLAALFACAALALTTTCLVNSTFTFKKAAWLGFLMACLQVTRSVMFALSVAMIPVLWMLNSRKFKTNVAGYLVGYSLLALPWLFLQQCTFGKASLIVDRSGHFNLFIGNNVDTLGWFSFPYPDCSNVKAESLFKIEKRSIMRSPERWLKLMLDKPVRLLKRPWNDFRTTIGPIDFGSQIVFHQWVLMLAAIGLIAGTFLDQGQIGSKRKIMARLVVLAYFVFHFIYALFIAVPRYEMSALPALLLFSAAGITALTRLGTSKVGIKTGIAFCFTLIALFAFSNLNLIDLVGSSIGERFIYLALALQIVLRLFALACFVCLSQRVAVVLRQPAFIASWLAGLVFLIALPAVALPIRAHGRWLEWSRPFDKKHSVIEQSITLPDNANLQDRQSYALIYLKNGRELSNDVRVSVNGEILTGPLVPAMAIAQELDNVTAFPDGVICPEPDFIVHDILAFEEPKELDLRGWYLMPIPSGQLKANQALNLKLEKISDRPNRIFGSYQTEGSTAIIPSTFLYSWEKGFWGVEGSATNLDLSMDEKIKANGLPNAKPAPSSFPPHPYLHALLAPRSSGYPSMLQLSQSNQISEINDRAIGDCFIVSLNKPVLATANHMLVCRVQAKLIGTFDCSSQLIAYFERKDKQLVAYPCHWFPERIESTDSAKQIDYAFPINENHMPGALTKLNLVFSGSKLPVHTQQLSVNLYEVPSIPIGPGHEIL